MSLCVFCGSSIGSSPAYRESAAATGRAMARRSIPLVYGGGRVGLMGVLANAVLEAGGEAIGVMPRRLVEREIEHRGLTSFHIVESMHERKLKMAELSDGFLALPGGAGTFEEIFEQWTWAQLGLHQKPCGFLNVAGYFNPLIAMIDQMVAEQFLDPSYARMLLIDGQVEPLFDRYQQYVAPELKWGSRSVDVEV